MQVYVRSTDRRILSYGYGVTGEGDPPPAGVEVITLDDTVAQAVLAAFAQPNGGVTLSADNTVVTLLPVPQPDPVAVARQTEQQAALSDLATQYDAAMTRLDQIINAGTPTNAQVVQAVRDVATILKRTLRLLKSEFVP